MVSYKNISLFGFKKILSQFILLVIASLFICSASAGGVVSYYSAVKKAKPSVVNISTTREVKSQRTTFRSSDLALLLW